MYIKALLLVYVDCCFGALDTASKVIDPLAKLVHTSRKREAVEHLEGEFTVSERRACQVLDQTRSTQRYSVRVADDVARLESRMHELVRSHPRFGYRWIAVLLQREGFQAGFVRV